MNWGPVDYESTALPTELPRLRVNHSSIGRKKLSNTRLGKGARRGYREKGYISHPMPTATSKKATKAHAVYFTRSMEPRLERNANVTETVRAKNTSAPKWVTPLNRELNSILSH